MKICASHGNSQQSAFTMEEVAKKRNDCHQPVIRHPSVGTTDATVAEMKATGEPVGMSFTHQGHLSPVAAEGLIC